MRLPAALLLLLVAALPALGETIANPAVPRDGTETVALRELWRAGGENDDVFFGLVASVVTGPQGNVHVLDSQMSEVHVYAPDGERLRTLFREGDGPGEVRQPRDMMVLADGRVGVIREYPGAVSWVHADGTPAGRMDVDQSGDGFLSLTGCAAAGDAVLLSGTYVMQDDGKGVSRRVNAVERFDAAGAAVARYASNATLYDFAEFRFAEREHVPPFWWSFAVRGDGTVACAPDRDAYRIDVFGPDGGLLRTIVRAHAPLERTDEEYARMRRMIESAMANVPMEVEIVVERGLPVIAAMQRGVQFHADGDLWVLTSEAVRPGAAGAMCAFDVFDDEGVYVRKVILEAPYDGRTVGVFLSGADRIVVVKGYLESLAAQFGNGATLAAEGEEPETPEVICYAMDR